MKSLLLGLALLAVTATAAADDVTLYKVEVIVFENLDPNALQAEDWPPNPGTPPLDNAVELSAITAPPPVNAGAAVTTQPPAAAPATAPVDATPTATASPPPPPAPTWQWLDDSQLTLNDQVQRLNKSQRYKTIVHVGWIQPVDSSDQGKAVHIYDGMEATRVVDTTADPATTIPLASDPPAGPAMTAPEADNPTDPESDNPAAPAEPAPESGEGDAAPASHEDAQSPANDAVAAAEQSPHILDGTFTLRRGRFLHVDVDLGYTDTVTTEQPATTGADMSSNGTTTDSTATDATTGNGMAGDTPPAAPHTTRYYVRMIDSRRIRDDSLNYLDHPLFGVLFTVTPYQPPATDDSAVQDTPAEGQ